MNDEGQTRIVLIHLMRSVSQRCPRKLLRNVGGKPLALWAMEAALRTVKAMPRIDYRPALWPGDQELVDLLKRLGPLSVPWIKRTERSFYGETVQDIYDPYFLHQLESYDFVILGNPCFPFVGDLWHKRLYVEALKMLPGSETPVMTAFAYRQTVYDEAGKPIYGAVPGGWNTKTQPKYFTPSHWATVYAKHLVGTPGQCSRPFGVLEVPHTAEFLDVDTEDDLALANAVAEYWQHHPKPPESIL